MGKEAELTEHGGQLRRIARGLLYDEDSADDAVQDAWIAALQNRPRPGWDPRAWLSGVVRNLARNRQRRDERRRDREREAARGETVPAAVDAAARLEATRRVVDAVQDLEEPYRTVILLRFFDDLAPCDVAKRQGVPVETVRTQVRRGLERLRRRLDARAAGDRGLFLAALVPLAGPTPWPITIGLPTGSWQAAAKWSGVLAMGTNAKVAVAVGAAALLSVAAVRIFGGGAEPEAAIEPPVEEVAVAPPVEVAPTEERDAVAPVSAPDSGRALVDLTSSAAASTRTWIVRGEVFRGTDEVYPNVTVLARLIATGEEPVELASQRIVTGEAGKFAWAIEPPADSVHVSVVPNLPDHIVYGDRALVLAGDPAPTGLVMRAYPLDLDVEGRVVDGDGNPIAGARVGTYQDREQTTTDAGGVYTVRASSVLSSITLYAKAKGYAENRTYVVPLGPGEAAAEDVVLLPDLRVVGRVVDEAGRPIEGATISNSPLQGVSTTSDEDGRYMLANLDPDKRALHVYVSKEGYVLVEEAIEDAEPGELTLDVTLPRGTPVTGRVVDHLGNPREGVQLTIGYSPDAWPQLGATSAKDGAFGFDAVGEGEHNLWAARAGLATWRETIAVPPSGGAPVAAEVVMHAGRVLAGVVVDRDGDPIPRVMVYAQQGNGWENDYVCDRVYTDDDGAFRLDQIPEAKITLGFLKKGYSRHEMELTELDDRELVIQLESAGRIAGRVVDGVTGEPLQSFHIRLVTPWLDEGEKRVGGYWAGWAGDGLPFVDTDGYWDTVRERFQLGAVAGVEAVAEGYAPTRLDHVVVTADPDPDALVLRMYKGSAVVGRVVEEGSGLPVEGAHVRRFTRTDRIRFDAYEPDWDEAPFLEATTGADGWFRLDDVPAGEMRLGAKHAEWRTAVDGPFDVAPGGARVERVIELVRGGTVTGTLLSATGEPRGGETIKLDRFRTRDDKEESVSKSTETGADGRFRFDGLPDGRYQLSHSVAYGDDLNVYELLRAACVENGGTTDVEMRPRGTATVYGTVQSEVEIPGDVKTVWLSPVWREDAPRDHQTERSRAARLVDGRFTLEHLEAGEYLVSASSYVWGGERREGRARFTVGEADVIDVVIVLEKR